MLQSEQKIRQDIDCPSDIIIYNCTIISSDTTLMWTVTVPGSTALQITYDNGFPLEETQLSPNILTTLVSISTSRLVSRISLTGPADGTVVQCGLNGSSVIPESATLSVNTSGILVIRTRKFILLIDLMKVVNFFIKIMSFVQRLCCNAF